MYKCYWAQLPVCLLCEELYDAWIQAWDTWNTPVNTTPAAALDEGGGPGTDTKLQLKEALLALQAQLPALHQAALVRLFDVLCVFLDAQEDNQMSAGNLAICWAPNLLRPKEETEQTILHDAPKVVGVVCALIEHYYDAHR